MEEAMILEQSRVARTVHSWFVPFVVLNLVDVFQTFFAITQLGAVELNPFANMLGVWNFLALKVLASLFVGYVLRRHALLILLTAGMLGAVLGNTVTLALTFF
jgi:hypothetical protein